MSRIYKASSIDLTHPTVTADAPAPRVSRQYTFISTQDIVRALEDSGWHYDSGTARKTRRVEDQSFTHHVLRFSHPHLSPLRDGTRPQAVILNNHMGTAAFRVMLGAFRQACANGLVIQSEDAGSLKFRHSGLRVEDIQAAVSTILLSAPAVFSRISRWAEQHVPMETAVQLAQECGRARWGNPAEFSAHDLLLPKRREDVSKDLWTTFNVIQESVVKGRVLVRKNSDAPQRFAPPVRGAMAQLQLNSRLWEIAETFAF